MNLKVIVPSTLAGILIGCVATGIYRGKAADILLLTALVGGSSSVITGLMCNSSARNKAETRMEGLKTKISNLEQDNRLKDGALKALESKRAKASEDAAKLQIELKLAKDELDQNNLELPGLKATANVAKQQLATIQELEATIEQYIQDYDKREAEFESIYEEEVAKRLDIAENNRIDHIFAESDIHCENFLSDIKEGTELVSRYRQLHQNAKRTSLEIGQMAYQQRLSFQKEREGLLEQIEVYQSKIAILQKQQAGILVEPEKADAKFDPDLTMGNYLLSHIHQVVGVPLRFYGGFTTDEGLTHLGYIPSKGVDTQHLANKISSLNEPLRNAIGVYRIESVNASKVLEGIEIVVRRSRPIALKEEEIYRIMERSSACTEILRNAMDHTKGGKPTMRVMAATGQGKGILVKNFIADWVSSKSGEVWFSDPMDGSSQDYWNMSKTAKSSKEGSDLLSGFVGEFNARKDKKSVRKDVHVLAVFDEFDKEHPDADKDKVKSVWTAIRHHKMNLILIGQDGEVGESGWRWDEMHNCTMLFVGSSIGTALKHREDLGISPADKRTLERQRSQIQIYLEDKNQGLGSDVMYRVALLVHDGNGRFLELPPALKGEVSSGKATIVTSPWESLTEVEKPTVTESKVCPGCGAKLRKAGNSLKCENKEHTRKMGKKTFPLEG